MVLTSTHYLCLEQKYENIFEFLSENFHFLAVKFSVYLNRYVFIMKLDGKLHTDIPREGHNYGIQHFISTGKGYNDMK